MQRNSIILGILKPKSLVVIALFFFWNSISSSQAGIPNHHKNLRLRAPQRYLQNVPKLSRDEKTPSGVILPESSNASEDSGIVAVGPFVGNTGNDDDLMVSPKKKDCGGMPSIAARGLVGPTLKRAFFALTKEEMEEKKEDQLREKRGIKRSEVIEPVLPWTCETNYEWHDMGPDHYPRFVRTAECKTRSCFNGFFRCRARRYKTKVLKRVSTSDATSCEEDDVSLPESLRTHWRFVTVTISLCCDCIGRVSGVPDV